MPEQHERRKIELSPAISIIVAGILIAGAILFTHYFPASSTVAQNGGNNKPTFQQQMNEDTYAQIAKALGADMTKYNACVAKKADQAKIDADAAEAQKAGGQGTPFTVIYDTKTKKALPVSGALPYAQIKQAIAAVNTQGSAATVRAPSSSDHIIGSPTAPIVLIEYSDFQCPFCQMIHVTLKQIVSESNGEVAWVYRHFPLYQIHPQAEPAANASECIFDQLGDSAFWTFANTVFES
jgi:protein-disulfide isomerase